jgi:hypothetical protein
MGVCADPAGFVVEPLSLVDIAVRVVEDALSISLISMPFSLIARPVGPSLLALSLTLSILPLALIGNSIIELDLGHFDAPLGSNDLPDQLIISGCFAATYEVFADYFLFLLFFSGGFILWNWWRIFLSALGSERLLAGKLRWLIDLSSLFLNGVILSR